MTDKTIKTQTVHTSSAYASRSDQSEGENAPDTPAQFPGDLDTGTVGGLGAFAQGIAASAPSVALASVPVGLYVAAGKGAFWAVVIGMFIAVLLATTIAFQARRTVSSGSLGTYAGNGLGPGAAFISGWSLLFGYIGFAVTGTLGAVLYLNAFLDQLGLGSEQTWFRLLLVVLVVAVAVYSPLRGTSFTARFELIFESFSLAVILVVIVAAYFTGDGGIDTEQFSLSHLGESSTLVAAVTAVGAYAGFESVASLGNEVRDAHRNISRSLIRVVLLLGLLYLFSTYPQVLHFNDLDIDTAVLPQVADSAGLSWINVFVAAAVTIAMVVFVSAVTNSASRSLYTFAREGALPSLLARVDAVRRTPVNAVLFIGLLALVFGILASVSSVGRLFFDVYGGYVANWGFLGSYLLTVLATPLWLRRIRALRPVHVLVSGAALIALGYVIISNFIPSPAWPYNVLPFVYLAVLAVGLGRYLYLKARRPEVAARIGSTQTLSDAERERLTVLGLLGDTLDRPLEEAPKVKLTNKNAGIDVSGAFDNPLREKSE
ncbi:Low-affinity putrescine importer PlaP [Corynebacterium provencense]|uniref:Low-affinity putrescine importer PlaP n=1 Tax=Corynebacterium provencense TaxID=1737425 RepID=A0A2Z3YQE2_9CORY|nr:APC family permease [Corynebacterium provencense]AWT26966.1 Low-affinity putrescine importer PlaP [Corynebacterium provencense]